MTEGQEAGVVEQRRYINGEPLLGGFVALVAEVEFLDLGAGPRGFAQEGETTFNTGIVLKAADGNAPAEFVPAEFLGEFGHDGFQREAVEGVVGAGL